MRLIKFSGDLVLYRPEAYLDYTLSGDYGERCAQAINFNCGMCYAWHVCGHYFIRKLLK